MEPNILPIWCIVDVSAILALGANPGTLNDPTNLGNYQTSDAFVAMVAPVSFLDGPNGVSELTVKAPHGMNIYVFMTTYRPFDISASLISINPNRPDVLTTFQLSTSSNIGTIEYMQANVCGYKGDYTGFNIVFSIQNPDGTVLGYYYWDPEVKVVA